MNLAKKLFYFILISALLVLALASCGGDGGENGEEQNPPEHIHEYGEWQIRRNPTCTVTGREIRYCQCGESQTRVTDLASHTWRDATAYAPKTCTACGATEGEPIHIPGLDVIEQDAPIIPWG